VAVYRTRHRPGQLAPPARNRSDARRASIEAARRLVVHEGASRYGQRALPVADDTQAGAPLPYLRARRRTCRCPLHLPDARAARRCPRGECIIRSGLLGRAAFRREASGEISTVERGKFSCENALRGFSQAKAGHAPKENSHAQGRPKANSAAGFQPVNKSFTSHENKSFTSYDRLSGSKKIVFATNS
jgi:hypothetical protein